MSDVRQNVVGDHESAGLEQRPGEREERLVVVLLGVEEDEVEDVLDAHERLVCVALDELGPLLEPGLGDVRPPRSALRRVALERDDATAEHTRAGGEPDRRVAPRAADLQHLDAGLRRREPRTGVAPSSERPPATAERREARRRARPRPPIRGARASHARVRQASGTSTTATPSSRTDTGYVSTAANAGRDIGMPLSRSNREP